jgi:hypothetical protein
MTDSRRSFLKRWRISAMQQEVHSINLRMEQNQIDLRECLKFHHPSSSDDEDDAPMADASWFSFLVVVCDLFWDICVIFLILCYICLISWIFYYSVYPSPSETVRGSNFCVVFIFTLFYPLSICDKKGKLHR